MCTRNPIHCIVPPRLLEQLLNHEDADVRAAARTSRVSTARLRGQRDVLAQTFAPMAVPGMHRSIMDAEHAANPTGKLVRAEGSAPVDDQAVDEAYDGLGATYNLYSQVFHRDSIDDKGLPLQGVVHYDSDYNNAFWNGARMIFGDGDGKAFISFTKALDVIGHELTHGVTEFTCNLEYHNQSGALNESMSDVFGTLVKQYALKQTVDEADWLIGAGILGPALEGRALRSMKDPGSAFKGDDQPGHMKDYMTFPDTDAGDYGGVHTNSGIPNKAFFLAATAIGGNAWKEAGQIWYKALLALKPTSDFSACATACFHVAGRDFSGREQEAVLKAWTAVGVPVNTKDTVSVAGVTAPQEALSSTLDEIAERVARARILVKG